MTKWLLILLFSSTCLALEQNAKILVVGHDGPVGRALTHHLQEQGYSRIITAPTKLDLCDQAAVWHFFKQHQFDYVFLGPYQDRLLSGIVANTQTPAKVLSDSLYIQLNVLAAAHQTEVKKLLLIGSNAVYPRLCPQPIQEQSLLSSPLEPTHQWQGLAKICGIKLCQAYNQQHNTHFISCVPANLYGPGEVEHSQHVLPMLIRKFSAAKKNHQPSVELWGSGQTERGFLHVDDLADACLFLMDHYEGDEQVNIGTNMPITIKDLAQLIKKEVGFTGAIQYDRSKPDGVPKRVLDTSLINSLGWYPKISLEEGIKQTIQSYQKNKESVRR